VFTESLFRRAAISPSWARALTAWATVDCHFQELDPSLAVIPSDENIAVSRVCNSSGVPQNELVIAIGCEELPMLALGG